jgi:hypothetical protein
MGLLWQSTIPPTNEIIALMTRGSNSDWSHYSARVFDRSRVTAEIGGWTLGLTGLFNIVSAMASLAARPVCRSTASCHSPISPTRLRLCFFLRRRVVVGGIFGMLSALSICRLSKSACDVQRLQPEILRWTSGRKAGRIKEANDNRLVSTGEGR